MALISSESITLMVNGTLQSEFFTMFWPTRFTYSTTTELKLGDVAEVGDGKDRREHRLQAIVLALLGELVHLQKALVAAALDFNEIGNLDGGGNLGKIEAGADRAH